MGDMIDVPFLIVGAGPVGLTAAQLLAQLGHDCMVVEQREGPQRHPAAHVVNGRTLEIFRQAGFDMDAIHGVALDPTDAGHVNFVTRLNGKLIGRLPFERQGPEILDITPTPLRNISQHRLEPQLALHLAGSDHVDLRYRHRWEASEQHDSGVVTVVRDLASDDTIDVRSRWLIAADGATSRVRSSLDIEMIGPPSLQQFIAVHFHADLRSLIANRLGVLHFVMDPEVSGTFISHDIDREWVFMTSYDATTESPDDYDEARCTAMINAAAGEPVPLDIVNIGAWNMSAQVAEAMRQDRIFLVGDAAHRFPPTGGLGLNTGVGDVHNLVWKLDAVEQAWADPVILDSYDVERRPVAETNCRQSTDNVFKMVSLIEALGITTDPTSAGMQAVLADPANAESIEAAVLDQATHFDMIGLQLGYAYAEGAVLHEGEPAPPNEDPRLFDPSWTVGERIEHLWLDDGRSSLDLIEPGYFTLLTGDRHESWDVAISAFDVPLRHEPLEQLGEAVVLLVRPDQHIAWRAPADTAPGELIAVLDELLSPSNAAS